MKNIFFTLVAILLTLLSHSSFAAGKSAKFICHEQQGFHTQNNTELTITVQNTGVSTPAQLRGKITVVSRYGFPPITSVDQPYTGSAVDSQNGTGSKAALLVSKPDGDFSYRAYVGAPLDFYKRTSFQMHLQGTRRNQDTNKTETYLSSPMDCVLK